MNNDRSDGLTRLFEPRGVAVIASMKEGGEGYFITENLVRCGFRGRVYPISRSQSQVHGLMTYPRIQDVDGVLDLSIVVTPPSVVPSMVEQCAQQGARFCIVVSEGFAESGPEGMLLHNQLLEVVRRTGIRVIGPNTLGVLNSTNGFTSCPHPIYDNMPVAGGIAYCSQTGLLSFGVHPIKDRGYPIGKICDFGNKSDLNETDLLDYLATDPLTEVIAMHLEDIKNGPEFIEAARRAVAVKPVLIFKPGRSEAGARAAASHTGSLAGDDQVNIAALKQAGIVRLHSWLEFWEIPRTLALQPLPQGNRLAIITASGGGGVMLVDAAGDAGLIPSVFTSGTLEALSTISPRLARNPVDVGPIMSIRPDPFSVYEEVVPLVLADPEVDCAVIVVHAWQRVVDTFKKFSSLITRSCKPVAFFGYGIDLPSMEVAQRQFGAMGLPLYFDLELAVRALGASVDCARAKLRVGELAEMTSYRS